MSELVWNLSDGANLFNVVARNKKELVINGQTVKLKELKKVNSGKGVVVYELPLGYMMSYLYTPGCGEKFFDIVINGRDASTNELYVPATVEWWTYLIMALYIIDFMFLCGGAIGGALVGGGCAATFQYSRNKKNSTSKRVVASIMTYAILTGIMALVRNIVLQTYRFL